MFIITVPDYMTATEFGQRMLADQLLLMHEYELHGEAAFDLIYPPVPSVVDDGDDQFLADLIDHISRPICM